jgi:hypothetical protein
MRLHEPHGDQSIDGLFEFYAVHHYVVRSDSLLFDSFADYEAFLEGDLSDDRGYAYFMRQPYANASRYRERVEAFLASDCHYEFELRLPHWRVEPFGA